MIINFGLIMPITMHRSCSRGSADIATSIPVGGLKDLHQVGCEQLTPGEWCKQSTTEGVRAKLMG